MSAVPVLEKIRPVFEGDLKKVDKLISDLTFSSIPVIPQISMHVIASGGKRLRPILTLLSSKLCNYNGKNHIMLAACVEFIHTATLLHDDVVDNSELRRGSKTANQLWGNELSILVGDFLLSRAFQLMVDVGSLDVLKILSDTSAIISEGQVMEIANQKNIEMEEETYREIIATKTAQLFAASCNIGAVIAGKDKKTAQALFDYGQHLGMAFQIVDDVLDYSAKQEQLGKTIGEDFREGKITLPVILAYRASDNEEKSFWKRSLAEGIQHRDDLKTALEIMAKYNILDRSMQEAGAYVEKGKDALSIFPDSAEKQALIEIIEFSLNRPY